MSRSPFAYPMTRSVDGDAGGAADLQTDIMRFMAILALCLMAIFALVQSIPLAPVEPAASISEVPQESPPVKPAKPAPEIVRAPPVDTVSAAATEPKPERIILTRPTWQPAAEDTPPTTTPPATKAVAAESAAAPVEPSQEQDGFTLRFESDQALMRLVATSQVGLYALGQQRAQRMTVSASRISFWDASTPNTFHEMDKATVPRSVVDALVRSGTPAEAVSWGVTLPGKMRGQLDELMQGNRGGSLLIGADGRMRLETS